MSNQAKLKQQWENDFKDLLVGQKIKSIKYQTDKEVDNLGWYSAALVIEFENGTKIFASQDDEGNNAGALFVEKEGDVYVAPVI